VFSIEENSSFFGFLFELSEECDEVALDALGLACCLNILILGLQVGVGA